PAFGPPAKKVAVVGAGCAGLAAASDLAKLGFGVTVYDALDQAGGTTLAGVPPFRLPREVIDRDIAGIVNENVELKMSTYVGRDEVVVDEEELGETAREGIEFVWLASPVEVLTSADGKVRGVKFIRNRLGAPDKSGRRTAEPIEGSEFEIPCETVLLALGQAPDATFLGEFEEFRVKRARD